MSTIEKSFDSKKLLHLLATSKYPAKLKVLDTLYLEPSPVLKVKSWLYTSPSGYLTLKHSQRIPKHSEIIKDFILQCITRPVSARYFISDVPEDPACFVLNERGREFISLYKLMNILKQPQPRFKDPTIYALQRFVRDFKYYVQATFTKDHDIQIEVISKAQKNIEKDQDRIRRFVSTLHEAVAKRFNYTIKTLTVLLLIDSSGVIWLADFTECTILVSQKPNAEFLVLRAKESSLFVKRPKTSNSSQKHMSEIPVMRRYESGVTEYVAKEDPPKPQRRKCIAKHRYNASWDKSQSVSNSLRIMLPKPSNLEDNSSVTANVVESSKKQTVSQEVQTEPAMTQETHKVFNPDHISSSAKRVRLIKGYRISQNYVTATAKPSPKSKSSQLVSQTSARRLKKRRKLVELACVGFSLHQSMSYRPSTAHSPDSFSPYCDSTICETYSISRRHKKVRTLNKSECYQSMDQIHLKRPDTATAIRLKRSAMKLRKEMMRREQTNSFKEHTPIRLCISGFKSTRSSIQYK